MLAIIGGIRGLISAIGGAGVAFMVFMGYNYFENKNVAQRASVEEASKWREANNILKEAMDARKEAAQKELNKLEKQLIRQEKTDDAKIKALRQEIERLGNETDSPDDTYKFPRSLRDQLDSIGR